MVLSYWMERARRLRARRRRVLNEIAADRQVTPSAARARDPSSILSDIRLHRTRANGRTGEPKDRQAGSSETHFVSGLQKPPPRARSIARTGALQLVEIPSTAVSTWGGAVVFLNVLLTRL